MQSICSSSKYSETTRREVQDEILQLRSVTWLSSLSDVDKEQASFGSMFMARTELIVILRLGLGSRNTYDRSFIKIVSSVPYLGCVIPGILETITNSAVQACANQNNFASLWCPQHLLFSLQARDLVEIPHAL